MTAGWFDVMRAQHAGMQGVWINRTDGPWEPFDGEPDLTIHALDDLAETMDA